jgi:hypothetical protein
VSVSLKLTGPGDTQLRGMLSALRALGSGAVVREAAKKVAPVLQELGDRPWQRRASVEGEPWQARTRRYYHSQLEKTGRTRRSLRSRAVGTNIVTSVTTPYARFHQKGTPRMVARPIFPTTNELPAVWAARIRKTITDHLRGALHG